MTLGTDSLPDAPVRRPDSVTAAVALGALTGAATLLGTTYVAAAVFTSGGAAWFTVAAAVVAVVQVVTGVFLIVGSVRLTTGAGRGLLFAGIALVFLVCATHLLSAVTVVASDPDDAEVVPFFLTIPCAFAVLAAGTLYSALRPSARAFVSGDA